MTLTHFIMIKMGRPKLEHPRENVSLRVDKRQLDFIDDFLQNRKEKGEETITSRSEYIRRSIDWFTSVLIRRLAEEKERQKWFEEKTKEEWVRKIIGET